MPKACPLLRCEINFIIGAKKWFEQGSEAALSLCDRRGDASEITLNCLEEYVLYSECIHFGALYNCDACTEI